MLFLILLSLSFLVFGISIIFIALFKNLSPKQERNTKQIAFSIIVAFKNEEGNIKNLVTALSKLDYPLDKFEIILIDDDSQDSSFDKAAKLIQGKHNFYLYKAENKRYLGKKGALDFGISKSNNPFILITDADCMPSNNWLKGYAQKFIENYDLLFGLAPFIQNNGLINKISCFENLRSSILTTSSAKLSLPYSAAARNLGFTKEAFEKIGGFSKTMETLSGDDDLLLREAVKLKMQIGFVDLEDTEVLSDSKTTLTEYVIQKSRHTSTSLHYLAKHKFILAFWHLTNIVLIFSSLLIFIDLVFAVPFLIKIISDMITILSSQKRMHYKFTILEIPFLQIIYEIFLVIFFLLSLRKNVKWR